MTNVIFYTSRLYCSRIKTKIIVIFYKLKNSQRYDYIRRHMYLIQKPLNESWFLLIYLHLLQHRHIYQSMQWGAQDSDMTAIASYMDRSLWMPIQYLIYCTVSTLLWRSWWTGMLKRRRIGAVLYADCIWKLNLISRNQNGLPLFSKKVLFGMRCQAEIDNASVFTFHTIQTWPSLKIEASF